jgi:ATP-dependent Clp protease ATP-binding subunit ClpA
VGRLPVVVNCLELGVEDLFQILKHSEGSIIRQYVQAFDAYGIEINFTDEGLHRLAEKAYQEQTGARSLVGVCERTFREFKYNLPHTGVRRLEVTAELVDSPAKVLERILEDSTHVQLEDLARKADRIAEQWSERNGIEIRLRPEAAQMLAQKAIESGKRIEDVFLDTFKNYEHGLNLIRETRGITHFEITSDVIRDPSTTLDSWIREYYIGGPN